MTEQCRPHFDFKQLGSHFLYLPSASVHNLPTVSKISPPEQLAVELDVLHSIKVLAKVRFPP